jgi:hypothetical protein
LHLQAKIAHRNLGSDVRAQPQLLREAATFYKVDTSAIAAKVKQDFVAREKAKKAPQPTNKPTKKAA